MLRRPREGEGSLRQVTRGRGEFAALGVRFPLILFFAAALFALGSCRTPAPPLPSIHPSQALPEGRDFYFFLSVPKNRDFLAKFFQASGLASRGSDYLLANSRLLYGAASIVSGREPRFVLAAEGDYSKSLIEFGISLESGWAAVERQAGDRKLRAFREKSSGLELAIPNDRLLILAWGSSEESLRRAFSPGPPTLAPETTAEFEAHGAAAFFPAPAETVVGLSSPTAPAFDRLFLFSDRNGAAYDLSGRVSLREERDGRILASVMKLFLADKMTEQGFSLEEIRTRLKLDLQGETLRFSGFVFPEADLAALLGAVLQKGMKGKRA